MAKRNLQSLMSGIIGTPAEIEAAEVPISAKEETLTKRPVGRPKKESGYSDETRATFVVSASLVRKIKYISVMEDCLQKDIIAKALSNYIDDWESENGTIPQPKK